MLSIVDQKSFNFGFRGPEIALSWAVDAIDIANNVIKLASIN
jgi:hypothetical protein